MFSLHFLAPLLTLCFTPLLSPQGAEANSSVRVLRTYRIPYRLTETKHIMVRAKLNGKGPYNFIVDTGAPMLFVAKDIAKQLGVTPDAQKMGVIQRVELEGGAVLNKIPARIEDPMQLRGMNSMGLAGARLDGILGYNILARFRMEIDLSQSAMTWHLLDYQPPPSLPVEIDPKQTKEATAGIANMEQLANSVSSLLARRNDITIRQRGFLGIELDETAEGVTVTAILPDSPAAKAGMQTGDRITAVTLPMGSAKPIRSLKELRDLLAPVAAGKIVVFSLLRDDAKRTLTVTAGKGGF